MAVDLTGINNENEFYTNHYLIAIFENDVKDVLSRWKQGEEDGTRAPYAKIRTICKNYFSFSNGFENEKTLEGRLSLQREWLQLFLPALGYDLQPQYKTLDAGFDIPILYESKKSNGAPDMWIIEGINLYSEDQDPLSLSFSKEQFQPQEITKELEGITLDTVITKFVFGMEEPPRWILVINNSQVMLLDRSKWNEKRMIRFDITEILGRKEDSTLKATAALLHRESICPADGIPLLDTLDEKSHKNAFSVSEDLKYALREAIELIGNETIYYLQEVRRKGVFSGEEKVDAEELTRECLRYMYRLLFILYIEARPELGYIPMESDAYRLGYSFENLRDLEKVKLNSEESKNGYFLNESIKLLFNLIYNGVTEYQKQGEFAHGKGVGQSLFEIPSLKTHLFDPERTPILNKVKFRNLILQRVIELMSLSRQGVRNNRLGRISYAQLGINQLGAVYEALLSYQGFFAETELYEVKKAGEGDDELKNAYFVKVEDLDKYTDEEKVYNKNDGSLKKYEKGAFIYRLAGRDREKSASYYTPETLTKCLVKYALKELLQDKSADDILKLTVCEPAMGSAAFLNEAINQLAEAYLEGKQRELGERIAHDEYAYERQKVKMYLADNNVFGVDLNPVAVELAEVSLWLNTISKENFVPWFGMQLVCGNSLIGARRQVFKKTLLKKENRIDTLWLGEVPERVMPNVGRNEDTVYHFLLPDKGMADYKDKVIKQLAGEDIKKINNWRKGFTKEFSKSEIKTLQKLSDTIDKLWTKHIEQQRDMRGRTTDTFTVWGQKQSIEKENNTETRWKDKVHEQELLSKEVRNSSPYRRLKLAMDYWCSLWFWPIEKVDLLPSRDEFLLDLSLILEGNPVELIHGDGDQLLLFPDTIPKQIQLKLIDEFGFVDVDKLCSEIDRFALVKELAEKYRFLHWELEFADVFENNGGFDLVLGNPPWIKVTWRKENILSEFEPLLGIKDFSAPEIENMVSDIIISTERKIVFFDDYITQTSTKNYINSIGNYYLLKNLQTNLYKCFLTQGWFIGNDSSIVSLFHQAELLSESKGILKREMYKRLFSFWQFSNAKLLFHDIKDTRRFAATITSAKPKKNLEFYQIVNLFDPKTIDLSFNSDGTGDTPGIKTDDNQYEIRGHKNRIVNISESCFSIFHTLFEEAELPLMEIRLPLIHSIEVLNVLSVMAKQRKKVSDIDHNSTMMFDETNARNTGIIVKEIGKVLCPEDVILSGSHIYNCNPFYQEAIEHYRNNQDFKLINLDKIEDLFYPRTVYKLNKGINLNIDNVNHYRNARRKLVDLNAERSLATVIISPGVKHINGIISEYFSNYKDLIIFTGLTNSIIFDFLVKVIGKGNLTNDVIRSLPFFNKHTRYIRSRVLRLNCLSRDYAKLWELCFLKSFVEDEFSKKDIRLSKFNHLTAKWVKEYSLINFYERRQALVEIDVIVAVLLGLSLEELNTIYKVQFPVLYKNEKNTWYDQKGKIVYSVNPVFSPINRKDVLNAWDGKSVESIEGYLPPFETCNREKDYDIAWKEFERRLKDKEDSS
jgi:hypothetical protein